MDIRTLALHLGLSIGTVSRALNGKKDVSAATRQRVIEAAALHGYTPNQSGRSLRRGRTGTVGFMLTLEHDRALHGDPFFMAVFEGVQIGLAAHDLDLVVLLARQGEDQLDFLRRNVSRGIVDGWLIAATKPNDERIAFLLDRDIPFVTLGRSDSGGSQPWIDLDFEGLVGQAISRFLAAGHRRIALIAPSADVNNSRVIIAAYRNELARAGLPFHAELIHQGTGEETDGEAACRHFFALPDPPDAILVMGETAPIGLYRQLDAMGIAPGRDVAIIGMRDNPALAALQPTLTCFTLSLTDLGQALARALIPYLVEPFTQSETLTSLLWPLNLVEGWSDRSPVQ